MDAPSIGGGVGLGGVGGEGIGGDGIGGVGGVGIGGVGMGGLSSEWVSVCLLLIACTLSLLVGILIGFYIPYIEGKTLHICTKYYVICRMSFNAFFICHMPYTTTMLLSFYTIHVF
jgi:hypothetical protein